MKYAVLSTTQDDSCGCIRGEGWLLWKLCLGVGPGVPGWEYCDCALKDMVLAMLCADKSVDP
jgi:hypothetical protein